MPKITFLATVISLAAGALAYAAYDKATSTQGDVRRLKARDGQESPAVEALEGEVNRLNARIAELERRARSAPREANAPAPSPATPTPSSSASAAPSSQPEAREAHRQEVVTAVGAHWRAWGSKHKLTEAQSEDLARIQTEAATRKLDNQIKLVDGTMNQSDTRRENQAVNDVVRRKAKALLNAEQFAQFEADKGVEWGSSYRRVQAADTKGAATSGPD